MKLKPFQQKNSSELDLKKAWRQKEINFQNQYYQSLHQNDRETAGIVFCLLMNLPSSFLFCEGLLWDYKDHLSGTVWVSLRPITTFSAVACVQSLINVKKYRKKLYHFVCRRRREIIYHRTKLNNNYANTWAWHYTIMRKTIKNCAFWHLMSVGSGMQWNAGVIIASIASNWMMLLYIYTDVANWTAKGLSPCEQPLKNDVFKFLLCNCCTWSRTWIEQCVCLNV